MFWRLFGLFIFLNLFDATLTQYLLTQHYGVSEANGIVAGVIDKYGWTGFWSYKILVPLVVVGLLCLIFGQTKRNRILKWVVIGFALCMLYMTGLSALVIIGDYKYAS